MLIAIQRDDHLAQQRAKDTTDCNTTVILAGIDTGQLVFNQGNKGGDQQDQRNIAVHSTAFQDKSKMFKAV
jgi:hypothetical protein